MSEPDFVATSSDAPHGEVAEFQGLYGAYHVSEILLQKLWLRREFNLSRARLGSGEPLRVLHPGTWNRLAGPDFRGAKLAFGDRPITGDIEVHFHAAAWTQHGHDRDPAYDDVVLHVVLFQPPPDSPPTRTAAGRIVPTLALMDLLWHDLEEYSSDDAVAALSGRDALPLVEDLLALSPADRGARVHDAAERRWQEKLHFTRRRIEKLGWEQMCHATTLEILGYRANRVAMLRVAEHFPWNVWHATPPAPEDVVALASDWWILRGVRPANQPRLRLVQYCAWMQRAPEWPARLRAWAAPKMAEEICGLEPAAMRRRLRLPELREQIARDLCGGQLGGTRFDTWICNLMLPAVAVMSDANTRACSALWRSWYPGDAPDTILSAATQLEFSRANGIVQGLLGLQLARMSAGR